MDLVYSGDGGPGEAADTNSLKLAIKSPPSDMNFECQFCETLYPSLEAYTAHSAVHETVFEYEHSCSACSQRFVCKEELQLHSRMHSDLHPYKCKLCSQTFRLARSLEYHLIGHGSKRVFQCSFCVATFLALADIHEHLRDHQMGRIAEAEQPSPVEEVAEEDEAVVVMMENGPEEEDENKYLPLVEATYPEIDENSSNRSSTRDRSRQQTNAAADVAAGVSHVKVESAAVLTLLSTATAATNGSVASVLESANEYDEEALFARAVNVKKTFCNLCNKKMATRKSLNTHYKSVHMKNAHTCSVCRTSFLFSRLLEEHSRRRKRIIPCEFCDLRFCSNKRWDSHIAKHRADSMGAPGGGVVMYPRAVPLSITTARQQPQQQQTVTSTTAIAINPRQSLLKTNQSSSSNNNNYASSSNSASSSPAGMMKGSTSGNRLQTTTINLTEGNSTVGKFPCDSCGKIFLSQHYLDSHLVKRKNPNFQFQCDVCDHRFSKKVILDEHRVYHDRQAEKRKSQQQVQQLHHTNGGSKSQPPQTTTDDSEMDFDRHIIKLSDSSFKCNCCHRTFKAINHLKCHLRYTHMKKNFKCRSCNQQFPFYKLYLAHMKNSKLCERCDKRICAKFDFKIHTQKCRGTAKMRNSTGNIAVPKSNIVEIDDDEEEEQDQEDDDAVIIDENGEGGGHMQLHSSLMLPSTHSGGGAGHLDDLMDTTSEYPSIPHFLMDDLIGVEPDEFKCQTCGKVFSKMTSLHMHSFMHDPNKELKCIFCNFLFLQRSSLNRHYRCRNTLHTCQVCKQAFCSHLNLRQHTCTEGMQVDRSFVDSSTVLGASGGGVGVALGLGGGVPVVGVAEESDEFMDVSELKGGSDSRKRNRAGHLVGVNSEDVSGRDESIELSDTEPDSLACMMCTRVLNTKTELDHHVATEHGTVTKCPICFKSFRSPTILHIHMAARASKKNKIECTECSHRFNKQAEFRKHFMYHTMKGNRPEQSDESIYSRIASKFPGK